MVVDPSLDSGSQSTGSDGVEEKPAHGTAFLEAVEITSTGQGMMIHTVLVDDTIYVRLRSVQLVHVYCV